MAKKIIICKDCGEEKPHCAKGLCAMCYHRRWYIRNQEEHLERSKQWYAENRERKSETTKQWYVANQKRRQETNRKWYIENRERKLETNRRWSAENKERHRELQLMYNYGITLADYDDMLEIQGSGCAICGKTPEENGKRLGVDHNHKTGEVRELLCDNCNRALGLLQDNPELCKRAMLYLKNWGDNE